MNLLRIFALLGIILSHTALAAPKVKRIPEEKGGSLEFERTLFDFGRIKRGEVVTASFPFKNSGQGPVSILGVQSPCGCTSVKFERGKIYKPGEKDTIEVSFDSSDFDKPVVKPVIVITNEVRLPNRTLTISGRVEPEFIVDPPVVDFGELRVGQGGKKEVIIDPVTKQSQKVAQLTLDDRSKNSKFLDIEISRKSERYAINVNLKNGIPAGFFKEDIFLKLSGAKLGVLKLPVRADIVGDISFVFPGAKNNAKHLEFGTIPPKDAIEREVAVASPSSVKVSFEKADVFINGESNEKSEPWVEVKESAQNSFKVRLRNPGNMEASIHGSIVFQTSDSAQKELRLNFFGLLAR